MKKNLIIECDICGKIGRDKDFISYFGPINLPHKFGICRECAKKDRKDTRYDTTSIFYKGHAY